MYEDKVVKKTAGVISADMDGEVVLMDVTGGEYYSLNETGSLIWNRLDEEGVSFDEICRIVMDEFEVEEGVCRKDTAVLLEHMIKAGVAEIVS